MPPKAKQPATGKSENKPKAAAPAAPAAAASEGSKQTATTPVTKPDTAAFHAEQDALKKEIDQLQVKLNAVKEKIALVKGTGGNERRDALRAELDGIRGQQGNNKASRGKLLEQIQTMQANIQTKVKALQAARGKIPYKSVDDVNAQIAKLDSLVNAGTMKIVDERKTLTEISNLKRLRKTVEGFQSEQDAIEKDRAEVDALRKQLDDPESKAMSEKYDTIKAELDDLKKESDAAYEGRTKLFDERTELQNKLDALWKKKKEASAAHREAGDAYWKKVNDDRARRAERNLQEKKAYEESRRREVAEELLETAKEPAFAADIQDCQTLIDYFTRVSGGAASSSSTELYSRPEVSAPKLELRKVADTMEGMAPMKKKGEEENNYFVAKKGKKAAPTKSYGQPAPAPPAANEGASAASAQLNIPFGTLSGLMALAIPPPTNVSEVPRVIEDLKTKKAWYQANQARVTKENVAKAEAAIEKLNKAAAAAKAEAEKEPEVEGEAAAAPAVEASA
ncbi:hypothetical protein M408DRAFT_67984 [Serendipita vermifera MAFF 305830]|uniref:Nuclear segregation protein Bfr1 n=1 Tax=Serendipita vermifera MAFF 305830 TaxID=933852 RepID=A0A0C2WTF7_SERVB|nr:hypothetical protein M408DRAFT_67984 [Serendipita vermifera MAFF 305830]